MHLSPAKKRLTSESDIMTGLVLIPHLSLISFPQVVLVTKQCTGT